MSAYIVITKKHTRNKAESALYAKDHEKFIEGHALTQNSRHCMCGQRTSTAAHLLRG